MPATLAVRERDELQRLKGRDQARMPTTVPLSPDAALAELRRLDEEPPTPTASPMAVTGTPPSTPRPAPRVSPSAVVPPTLPALPLGPGLPGMPEYVVVGRTYALGCAAPARDIPTQRVHFVDYLRNVLPNEWVASWSPAALDAGAIAAKQFAWYTTVIERKWRSQGYPFDLVDSTCDQYYRDASADPRTDAAIQRTWGTLLTRHGVLLHMYYRDTEATCGGLADCMGQVESAVLASAGQSSLQILARYYNAPGTAVRVTGARLPTQLPPVPPAPPILLRPAPTLTPTLLAPTPTVTVPSGTVTPTAELAPMPASSTPTGPVPTVEPPTATAATAPEPPATPTEQPTTRPEVTTPPPPLPSEPTGAPLPLAPLLPTTAPVVMVPNLVGLGENQAKDVLAGLGVRTVVVDYQGRDRLGELYDQFPPYAVVSHTPPAGAPAIPDMAVVLGVRAP